jgi:hypothetical protein
LAGSGTKWLLIALVEQTTVTGDWHPARSGQQIEEVMRMKAAMMRSALCILAAWWVAPLSTASAQENGDLAAAVQNPVASLISVPIQTNVFFGIGPNDEEAIVTNIQPVVPFELTADWNVITRTILPIIYVPDTVAGLDILPTGLGADTEFGLGDINFSAYFTLGVLARQLWSFAGDDDRADVNQMLVQPFVNYNLANGWYLASSPVITSNWNAPAGERWTVPVGGGFGKLFTIGKQPVNAQLQGFYNVESPTLGPDWSVRLQVQFLFPK